MNQSFIEGRRIPVTKIVVGPCVVTQIKKMDKEGYWAVKLGFGTRSTKNTSKALQGHLKTSLKDKQLPRTLREIRLDKEPEGLTVGDSVLASDVFKLGDIVSVTGTSKGKGFAGVVKRHHFAGGPKTHGQSDRHRAPGSIGQGTTPGRIYKGKRMAGRMGDETITLKNLQIVAINDTGEIEVSGLVQGITNGILLLKKIASGKLEGITEVQAQVVEGEAPAGEVAAEGAEAKPEVKTEAPKEGAQNG